MGEIAFQNQLYYSGSQLSKLCGHMLTKHTFKVSKLKYSKLKTNSSNTKCDVKIRAIYNKVLSKCHMVDVGSLILWIGISKLPSRATIFPNFISKDC